MSYARNVNILSNMPFTQEVDDIYTSTPGVGNTVVLPLDGHKSCAVAISGTWSGTLVVESSADGGLTWTKCWLQNVSAVDSSEILRPINAINANGVYSIYLVAGITHYRVRATTDTTWVGTATIRITATEVAGAVFSSTSIVQNVLSDLNNVLMAGEGSPSNLAVNGVFAGTASSTLGVAGLQVNLNSDQNMTVYIDQSNGIVNGFGTVATNGTTTLVGSGTKFLRDLKVGDQIWVTGETVRVVTAIASDVSLTVSAAFSTTSSNLAFTHYAWDITDQLNFYVGIGGQGWTIQATSAYVRVRLKNIGVALTTFIRLQTVLCPIVEAIPRAMSSEGNLKVGVYEVEGDLGVRQEVTPNNEVRTSSPVRLVGAIFPGSTLDDNFWSTTLAGTNAGTVTQAGGVLSVNANSGTATIGSSAAVQSLQSGRYTAGAALAFQMVCRLPAVTGANVRRWGVFSTTDGFFFEHDGTNLSLVCRTGSSDSNRVASGAFNGVMGNSYVIPVDTAMTCKIIWTTRKTWFIINDQVIHTFTGSPTPLCSTFSLPVRAESNNANGNTNGPNSFTCRSGSIRRFGLPNTRPTWKNQHNANVAATVLKRSPGTLQRVVINACVNAGTVTLYDALTATNPIASLVFTAGGANPNLMPFPIEYNLDFYTGLCWTVTGAGMDVTVVYE